MKIRPITDQDISVFHECFELDSESGVIVWKKKTGKKVIVGTEAGSCRADGYKWVQLNKKRYLTHRVVYAMTHGHCISEIDHINGDPSDNRPCNLRAVNRSQQNMNKSLARKNKFGLSGICFHKNSGLYQAKIRADGRRICLGYHKTPEEAHQAYLRGVEQYHGEYRRAA